MKKNLLLATACFIATTFATTAWASSSIAYDFKQLDSTENNPEVFHCELSDADASSTTVTLRNFAEMILGFDKSGRLTLPKGPYHINNVYFNAYHDPAYRYKEQRGRVIVTSEKGSLVCAEGTGTNRTLMPGSFGVAP